MARTFPPDSGYCKSLKNKMKNIQDRIAKREKEYEEDPLQLPEACPGDEEKPSLSRRGHRKLIDDDKKLLEKHKNTYREKCTQQAKDWRLEL